MIVKKAEFISFDKAESGNIEPINVACNDKDLEILNINGFEILANEIKDTWFPYNHIIKDIKGRYYLAYIDERKMDDRIRDEYTGKILFVQVKKKKAEEILIELGQDWEFKQPQNEEELKSSGYKQITVGLAHKIIELTGREFHNVYDAVYWVR